MTSATLLDLLPPPCARDPRRTRFAAKLVARSLREFQEMGGADEPLRTTRTAVQEWLPGAERLAQRVGGEPSLARELDALRAAIARAYTRLAVTAGTVTP
jgi:hypothetical protein